MIADFRMRAALWTVGSLLSFSAMAVAGRELGDDMPTVQILAARSVLALAVTAALLTAVGWQHAAVQRRDLGFLALRNAAHLGATFCWFLGLSLLPIAEVFAIEFTMPVWTAVLSMLLLGERPGRVRLLGIGLGFAGAMVILRPGAGAANPDALIVLLAAIGFAVSFVVTRYIIGGMSTVGFLFYMSLMQAPPMLALAVPVWHPIAPVNFLWLGVTAAGGLTAHYCLARALRIADASLVAPMDFLRLPLIALVGAAVYGEQVELWVGVGAAVVCLGNWLNLRGDVRVGNRPSSTRASIPQPGPVARKDGNS